MNDVIATTMTDSQCRAFTEIMAARRSERRHLLSGWAGSGKTFLMRHVAAECQRLGLSVIMCAPTHKAVAVLRRNLLAVGLTVPCQTVQSLLSLRPKPNTGEMVFERAMNAKLVYADVIVVDECSMLSLDLMTHIHLWLSHCFVLFVGDPAQLPPVGEIASQSFGVRSHSHLETIVRQAMGNPILEAASVLRANQDAVRANLPVDWSWMQPRRIDNIGVFTPEANAMAWMRKAFTSNAAMADADAFRYLCWTNDQVRWMNSQVHEWIHGRTDTPYVPGERILLRSPLFESVVNENGKAAEETLILSTNEEVIVETIEASEFQFSVPMLQGIGSGAGDIMGWEAALPSWHLRVITDRDEAVTLNLARGDTAMKRALARMASEAKANRHRWQDFFRLKNRLPAHQHTYALTVHTSQGSTFKNVFIDVENIRKREATNQLEMQQILYVAATRPTTTLVLV